MSKLLHYLWGGELLAEHGMVGVLLLLCAFFSVVTWAEQHPAGAMAAELIVPKIREELGEKGRVVILVTITENGTIQDIRLAANSGTEPLDRAAMGAITASNPFAKLPPNFDGDHIVLQFTFLYNIR